MIITRCKISLFFVEYTYSENNIRANKVQKKISNIALQRKAKENLSLAGVRISDNYKESNEEKKEKTDTKNKAKSNYFTGK